MNYRKHRRCDRVGRRSPFYKHIGVDPIRIIGSALSNFTSGGLQGGSTLTQQLIKLSFFSTSAEDQTLKRKAQEAWMAVRLEQKSKQEILTYYVNKVYMSNGLYGMETASEMYFGKKLSELSLPQTALLAGMPQPLPPMILMFIQIRRRKDEILFCIRCFKTKKSLKQNMIKLLMYR